jgi:hypothetical protein
MANLRERIFVPQFRERAKIPDIFVFPTGRCIDGIFKELPIGVRHSRSSTQRLART